MYIKIATMAHADMAWVIRLSAGPNGCEILNVNVSAYLLGITMPRFELIAIEATGCVVRSTHSTADAGLTAMQAIQSECVFKCLLGYLDDTDLKPRVVARTS